jgi:D-xylulose reductase
MQAPALVLEAVRTLAIRPIDLGQSLGPKEVRVRIHTVGICGSDVHYYTHGRIGPFVVTEPMVLGHEAAGTVTETGAEVTGLRPGDRVCMEPGLPDPGSRAAKLGLYNVDPAVTFWATPPVHGCLTESVIHPAAFTYRLPPTVSFAEGAMVEPFAIGMQAAARARIAPGDVALVIGAGPIGYMVALAALAGGCARVMLADVKPEKLAATSHYPGLTGLAPGDTAAQVLAATEGWGADIVFECSGQPSAFRNVFAPARPGGAVVFVGMPVEPVVFDVVAAQVKELRMETVFRYANVYDRAIELIASGKTDLKPLITETFAFADAIAAFERAAEGRPRDIKLQIEMPGAE